MVCVFADGLIGSGGQHMKIQLLDPDGRPRYDDVNDPDTYQWRAPGEVIGWRVACECSTSEPRRHVLLDTLWTRVWNPADEDLAAHRIYAGDPSSAVAADVDDREDLQPFFRREWHQHIAPDTTVHAIATLSQELRHVEAKLDDAVAEARNAGVSWDKIGRAVGITRQAAQKRWGRGTSSAVD